MYDPAEMKGRIRPHIAFAALGIVMVVIGCGSHKTNSAVSVKRGTTEQQVPSDIPTGVLNVTASPFGRQYGINNQWQDFSPDKKRLIQVYAAARQTDPDRGLIIVNVTPARDSGPIGRVTVYQPSVKATGLEITSVDYPYVQLTSSDFNGSFDIETGKFKPAS
jgi:hypothetical protein